MIITDKSELVKFSSPYRVWQGIPSVERTKGGRLFAAFYSGMSGETCGNFCMVLKSDDDGKSWTEPVCVAYAGEMHRCFDPVLWMDPLDRLWFTWAKGYEDGVYASICEDPDEEELVWSEAFYVGDQVMMNKPTVLSTGEWLFPLAVWDLWHFSITMQNGTKRSYVRMHQEEFLKKKAQYSGANVHKSVDHGNTIEMLGGCRHIKDRSFDEHMIYEKKNGVLVMLTRTRYGIARSFSYDRGLNWTIAEDSGISGPSSRFHVRRLKSGRLLLINHHEFTGRNNLTAYLSEDDGETWPYKLLLDERSQVSYPDMTEGEDGYLYIIYDRERGCFKSSLAEAESCAREILLSKIHENDILKGNVEAPHSFERQIVSKLGKYMGTRDYYETVPKIDREDFAQKVVTYSDADQILDAVFVHYPMNCESMPSSDLEKLDELLEQIQLHFGDKAELYLRILDLTAFLEHTPIDGRTDCEEPLINSVLEYLMEHMEEELRLKELAGKQNVSMYYLCHLFKKKTGLSIYEYRNVYRFTRAKQLLTGTKLKIGEISCRCGFADSSYFTRKFREMEHMSPSAYRRLNTK